MGDSFSKGFPFELGDLWHQSDLRSEQPDETLFRPLSTSLLELEIGDIDQSYGHDLRLPDFGRLDGDQDGILERIESEVPSPITASTTFERQVPEAADVWSIDFEIDDQINRPALHTWEAFEKADVPDIERTAYLSEAGPTAFDAALIHWEKTGANPGVLAQDVMLRALCNLAVGRSSLFFQWEEHKRGFVQILPDVPISGYSIVSSKSLIDSISDLGNTYRNLNAFAYASRAGHWCPAVVAFKGCVNKILDRVEEHFMGNDSRIRSALQLQKRAERPLLLLQVLQRLAELVGDCETDEEVISILSDHVHSLVSAGARFSETLRSVLASVSAPWLGRLCSDLGLVDGGLDHAFEVVQDSGEDNVDISYSSFDAQARKTEGIPDFVSKEDRVLVEQTKTSLRVLRQYSPDQRILSATIPELDHAYLNRRSSETQSDFRAHRHGLTEMDILRTRQDSFNNFGDSEATAFGAYNQYSEDLLWKDHESQYEYLRTLDTRMSQPVKLLVQPRDNLEKAVVEAFEEDSPLGDGIALSDTMSWNPLERLRPAIQLQANSINRTLFCHLFRACRLRHHLSLQRQYHLFGNGDFVSRLSKALFSADTQSAERKRGVIPTGGTMGLRLGARQGQRWPPASSELRLTLMGVLTETYRSEMPAGRSAADLKELPGGLSFSIRELPDEDIERVMDPASLYALDFLRLQYTAPPCVDAVLTLSSMQIYDGIFRFLLRMLRVLHVTTQLQDWRDLDGASVSQRRDPRSGSKRRFAIEAHHIVSTLMSHFMEVGIEAPWRSFMSSLIEIEKALDSDNEIDRDVRKTLVGLDGLHELHRACLESIRSRLFLRRKQQKVSDAVENVCTSILSCASAVLKEEETIFHSGLSGFEQSIKELLTLLQTLADKPAKVKADMDSTDDSEAMKLLILRLNWNEFYEIPM